MKKKNKENNRKEVIGTQKCQLCVAGISKNILKKKNGRKGRSINNGSINLLGPRGQRKILTVTVYYASGSARDPV